MPTTTTTTTTIKKDGSRTTTAKTRRKKSAPVIIDDTTYTDYRQCIHVFGVRVASVCQNLISTIDAITGYWPLGERNSKLAAIRHVMDRTACFSRNLTLDAITGKSTQDSAEEGIDF